MYKFISKQTKPTARIVVLFLVIFFISAFTQKSEVNITGELKKWHTITLTLDGPLTSELDENNPFLNYRLDVTFSKGNKSYTIPGFYAADGNASESSGDTGNKWMVRFTPDDIGEWNYAISFKKGENIAVAESASNSGESAGFFDRQMGSFVVANTDKSGIDNRAKGRLEYIGEPYLRFAENKEYFIKLGVDAPENLLGYTDFDAATNALGFLKKWEPHAKDFNQSAEKHLWQGSKGKNLLGAISYLSSEYLNAMSFLTFNVDGDDRNVFPYILKVPESEYEEYASKKKNKEAWETMFHKTRLDVSKLEQWERVFDYAEQQGLFLHFKTNETETDHLMDRGVFGTEGKLYYRELIARFGHHLVMNWNLGEENNQPIEEVIKVAKYVQKLDAYNHHMVVHTFPNQDDRYAEFIGDKSPMTGASLQLSDAEFTDVHPRVIKWKNKSDATGKRWALAVDEPGKAKIALLPDDEDKEHNLARQRAMWGTLMAGGYGVEWYFGYASPNSDLTCEDFRSRDMFWDQNKHARKFFEEHLPFWEMEPADELLTDSLSYCLAIQDEVYAVYRPQFKEKTTLDLGASGKEFKIKWFNPRTGGRLMTGSQENVSANGVMSIGFPPEDPDQDWLTLLTLE
jgi:hypothetical protein